jgi:hypothetical protein
MPVEDGYIYSITGVTTPILCHWGMHASLRIEDAYKYCTGLFLSKVRLFGKIESGYDKLAAQHREVLVETINRSITLLLCCLPSL